LEALNNSYSYETLANELEACPKTIKKKLEEFNLKEFADKTLKENQKNKQKRRIVVRF
jgi:hypothetical protein